MPYRIDIREDAMEPGSIAIPACQQEYATLHLATRAARMAATAYANTYGVSVHVRIFDARGRLASTASFHPLDIAEVA